MHHGTPDLGDPFNNTKLRAYVEGGPFYYQRESPAILVSTAEAVSFLESQPYNARWTIAQAHRNIFLDAQSTNDADNEPNSHQLPETQAETRELHNEETQEQEMQRVLEEMATFSRRRVDLLKELAECSKGEEQIYEQAARNPKLHKMFVAFMALHVNDDSVDGSTQGQSMSPMASRTNTVINTSDEIERHEYVRRVNRLERRYNSSTQKRRLSYDWGPSENKYQRR